MWILDRQFFVLFSHFTKLAQGTFEMPIDLVDQSTRGDGSPADETLEEGSIQGMLLAERSDLCCVSTFTIITSVKSPGSLERG